MSTVFFACLALQVLESLILSVSSKNSSSPLRTLEVGIVLPLKLVDLVFFFLRIQLVASKFPFVSSRLYVSLILMWKVAW